MLHMFSTPSPLSRKACSLIASVIATTACVYAQAWDEDGERIRKNARGSFEFFDSRMLGAELQLQSQADFTDWRNIGMASADFIFGLDYYRDRVDSGRIPPGGTPGYTLVHLRGGSRINEHLQMHISLENLLDEAYRTHGSGSNEPGFGVRLGIELQL